MLHTAYLFDLLSGATGSLEAVKPNQPTFVIGVKNNSSCSLETVAKRFPEWEIRRLPETNNPNYLKPDSFNNGEHILQPAFITRKVAK